MVRTPTSPRAKGASVVRTPIPPHEKGASVLRRPPRRSPKAVLSPEGASSARLITAISLKAVMFRFQMDLLSDEDADLASRKGCLSGEGAESAS